jgi:2-oxoglutarate dehydrogenase complex dehydrogenase (E1) component-like enzyme
MNTTRHPQLRAIDSLRRFERADLDRLRLALAQAEREHLARQRVVTQQREDLAAQVAAERQLLGRAIPLAPDQLLVAQRYRAWRRQELAQAEACAATALRDEEQARVRLEAQFRRIETLKRVLARRSELLVSDENRDWQLALDDLGASRAAANKQLMQPTSQRLTGSSHD